MDQTSTGPGPARTGSDAFKNGVLGAAVVVVVFAAGLVVGRGAAPVPQATVTPTTDEQVAQPALASDWTRIEKLGERLDDLEKRKGESGERFAEHVTDQLTEIRGMLARKAPSPSPRQVARPDPNKVYTVPVGSSPVRGPKDAPATIVAFMDFACPFCSKAAGTLKQVRESFEERVRIVFKHFPLSFHTNALLAHKAAEAAKLQGRFWPMHDLLIANQKRLDRASLFEYAQKAGLDVDKFTTALDSPKIASAIEKDKQEGRGLGVRGTPSFFINGRFLSGAKPYAQFASLIERAANGPTASPTAGASDSVPKLVFESERQDLGAVRPGTRIPLTFGFRNAGTGVLRFERPKPCCGIVSTRLSAREIPPGDEGQLSLVFVAGKNTGISRKTVSLRSNDPARPRVVLTILADVRGSIVVEPRAVQFGTLMYDTPAQRELTVRSEDGTPFRLLSVESSAPEFHIKGVDADVTSSEHTLSVAASPQLPARAVSGTISIATDVDEGAATQLAVAMRIRGKMLLNPPSVFFGTSRRGVEVRRSVSATALPGMEFQIKSVRVGKGPFEAKLSVVKPGVEYTIHVTFVAPAGGDDPVYRGQLVVETDIEGETEVRVDLLGRVVGAEAGALKTPSTQKPPQETGGVAEEAGPAGPPSVAADNGELPAGVLEVWLFYASGCRHCREAHQALESVLAARDGDADLTVYDTDEDASSISLARATLSEYPGAPAEPPSVVAFVGDQILLGEDEVISRASELIQTQLERGAPHLKVRRPKKVATFREQAEMLGVVPIVLAGLADGVNPCAFAAMVLLISVLGAARLQREKADAWRRDLLLGGVAFCAGVFVTYYLAGLLILKGVRGLDRYPVAGAVVFWAVLGLALLGAVLSIADAVTYARTRDPKRLRLKVPEVIRRRFAPLLRSRFTRFGLVFGGFAGGVTIALLEGICTGQMYLPTIQHMARTPGIRLRGATYLLLYNSLFMLPLLVILGLAVAGVRSQHFSAFLQRHLVGGKIAMGTVFLILAGAMLAYR